MLSWEQKEIFEQKLAELDEAGQLSPSYAALLFLMLHTGLSPGEANALKAGDVDFQGKRLRVERSATIGGVIKSTKTVEPRWVDLGPNTLDRLRRHITWLEAEAIARGWETEWLFPSETGTLPLLYVALQLGHAKPTITLKYYARWIPSGNANHVGVLEGTLVRTPSSAPLEQGVVTNV